MRQHKGPEPRPVLRLLRLFADVRAGEVGTALLLGLNVFLLLLAYYLIKTVREPLILTGGGAEVKAYAAAGQSLLLIPTVKAFSKLAEYVDRVRLITLVTVFFAFNLVLFYILARLNVPYVGVAFFLWVGVFNVTIIAQAWAFANDVYTEEQGNRLFAIVGIGSSLGAVAGAWVADALILPLGPYRMMLLAAALMVVCLVFPHWVQRREHPKRARASAEIQPLGPNGGFQLVVQSRYLLLLAALSVLANWINTTGEYVLDRAILEAARLQQAAGGLAVRDFVGEFRASFYAWVNLVGVLLQLFVVSRVLKHAGVRWAIVLMPVVSLMGYSAMAVMPVLGLIAVCKGAENSIDYSLQNTARQALFLVTSREAKYKAKAVIDTFLVRTGDVLAAATVALGSWLAFSTRQFAIVNVVLVSALLAASIAIGREHRRKKRTEQARERQGEHAQERLGAPVS